MRVCVYARPQPHLASIATIFPPLFFFVHVERKVRLRIQHAVAIRGVASRFVTLGKLKFPTLFLSLSPHLPSLSLPIPALFPSTSFPPLLARSFRKTFRSHWDKSIFQLLKLIEYRFWCSLEQSAPCCIRWCYTSWNVIIVPTNFPTYAFSTARSKLVIII